MIYPLSESWGREEAAQAPSWMKPLLRHDSTSVKCPKQSWGCRLEGGREGGGKEWRGGQFRKSKRKEEERKENSPEKQPTFLPFSPTLAKLARKKKSRTNGKNVQYSMYRGARAGRYAPSGPRSSAGREWLKAVRVRLRVIWRAVVELNPLRFFKSNWTLWLKAY